jgi:hypothetical protein
VYRVGKTQSSVLSIQVFARYIVRYRCPAFILERSYELPTDLNPEGFSLTRHPLVKRACVFVLPPVSQVIGVTTYPQIRALIVQFITVYVGLSSWGLSPSLKEGFPCGPATTEYSH